MAGLDLATCEAKLAEYLAAETAVLSGQEYDIDGDRLKLADLDRIQHGIKIWDRRCQSKARTGMLVREVIPR